MGDPTRCAVLGDPIEHSLSPVLHRAGFAHHGLDWSYGRHRVDEQGLAGFLAGLDPSWRGLSLTMPLKRMALALADSASDLARLAGAANTLLLDGGRRAADNTDIPGAAAALRERHRAEIGSAVVLGGGATATSTGIALVELGARRIVFAVRSPERAAETVASLRAHPAAPQVETCSLADVEPDADVLVSTVPAAAQGADLVRRCSQVPVIFDVLYHPWPTPLAASVGSDRTLVGGLDLLVHQAALQFEAFTQLPAPLAVMRAAGEDALAARG